ncbi:DUF222 domain-containing protein [Microbispora hainanensis]|uniref:HNH endonuclease signature motif containing protein n=2 Tax=Microbispora TaxID=2005 RepID=UPI0032449607
MAQELALTPLPDDVDVCLAEAEELLFARDRITSALADRVGRVHRAGQARQHGHASTRCWLRTSGGMTVGGAGRLLTLGAELPRLPVVREKFAAGELAAGVVEAICAAVAGLSDEQAGLAEPILVDLAGKAGAAEVAKAGRHLRAVLDPDGEERDERADYGRRFLRVRPGKGGGVEGEFYLPREAGARLMALLQAYAKLRAQGDDRPLTVRQADALIALLEQKIAAELLVVVSAESLPTDPETTADPETTDDPYPADPATEDPAAPATEETDPATEDTADPAADDDVSDHFADLDDSTPSDYAPDPAGTTDEPSQAQNTADHVEDAWHAEGFGDGQDDTSDPAAADADDTVSDVIGDPEGAGGADRPAADATGDRAPGEAGAGADAGSNAGTDEAADAGAASADDTAAPAPADPDDTSDYAPDATGGTDAPHQADDAVSDVIGDPGAAGGTDAPDAADGLDSAETEAEAEAGTGAGSDARECEPPGTASTASPDGDGDSHTAPSDTAPSEAVQPDPPPEDASARHTHAGHRPAGDCRHGQGTPGALGTALGSSLRASLGMVPPGLLLATGQVLPVSSVHRLARTSTLVRIVMNTDGQVLDMGRKVRLATPAQRRAVFARYATCWVDGCPLPATMCQIDHADNWSTGGLTDLKLLGPACQFHNRDRYQHPDRYTRRNVGEDRWAFTYHRLGRARRLRE